MDNMLRFARLERQYPGDTKRCLVEQQLRLLTLTLHARPASTAQAPARARPTCAPSNKASVSTDMQGIEASAILNGTVGGMERALGTRERKTMMSQPTQMSLSERTYILDSEVERYVRRGYRFVSGTPTTAQLVKPKEFSFLWATVWLFVLVIGLVVYILYYTSKKDDLIHLEVDVYGTVRTTMS